MMGLRRTFFAALVGLAVWRAARLYAATRRWQLRGRRWQERSEGK